jgi:hypothetical protein
MAMSNVMDKESAELELQRFEEYFDIEETPESDGSRRMMIRAIQAGRVELDEDAEQFRYTLRKPVTQEGDAPIQALTIREPNGGEMRKANTTTSEFGQTIDLIAAMNGYPSALIDRVGMKDLGVLGQLLSFFV